MAETTYEEAIEQAARRLNELYFMIDDIKGYGDIKKGVCLGLGIAFDEAPQNIACSINNFED